ncbi:MAG TPA: protein kinase [Gemmatales bacterium]|nr:protein kinase [Gemmatales bacterium]
MEIVCTHCAKRLEFSGEPPNFCSFCGKPLRPVSTSALALAEAPTLPPRAPTESQVDLHAHQSTWLRGTPGAALPADEPTAVGNYRLLRRIGGGGMGTVYEAEDQRSGQRVALKLISRDFVGHADSLQRFRLEGRLASQLSHPRCVFVLAVSEEQGRPCIVMELMTGQTLAELVAKRGPLDVREAVAMIADVMDGLIEAHRLGLVHRDVKPSNCFLEANGRVKIGDFGLAKSLLPTSLAEQAGLTKTGSFMGTPLYASPEQIKGEKVDQQADVYAVSATLYFLLTGKAPFESSGDPLAVMARIVADDVPPLRTTRSDLPAELEEIVLKGLERDRKERWATMAEMRQALTPFLPRRRGYVDRGLRQVAYLIDLGLLSTSTVLLLELVDFLSAQEWLTLPADGTRAYDLCTFMVAYLVHLIYFVTMERRWGASVGKWLMRLRVHQVTKGLPPNWGQALRRTLVFLLCFAVVELPLLWLVAEVDPQEPMSERDRRMALTWHHSERNLVSFGALFGGMALVSVTMRRQNNLRGVHEFASGTQVVRLPGTWFARPMPALVKPSEWQVIKPDGMPEQVDRFHVVGALAWEDKQQVLTASDPSLERAVWVWRRQREKGELCPTRRGLSRPTRWRWLAGGHEEDGWCWDAFLSRAGVSLPQMIQQVGARSWTEARPVLRQLTDELTAALTDQTVPPRLGPDQVWLDEKGHVHLLDIPLAEGSTAAEPAARALHLLQNVATLLLEGQQRDERDAGPIRVALPLSAEKQINDLLAADPATFDLAHWTEVLHETDEAPTETSRLVRLGELLATALVLFLEMVLLTALIVPLLMISLPEEVNQRGTQALNVSLLSALLLINAGLSWLGRGGMTLRWFRLALRTDAGRLPSRWRAATRTILAGLPIVAGMLLMQTRRNDVLWYVLFGTSLSVVLLSYPLLVLLWPQRTWYDWLTGTRVVPK